MKFLKVPVTFVLFSGIMTGFFRCGGEGGFCWRNGIKERKKGGEVLKLSRIRKRDLDSGCCTQSEMKDTDRQENKEREAGRVRVGVKERERE